MKEQIPFPKKAARYCLASPFITALIHYFTKSSTQGSQFSQNIVLLLSLLILLSGIILGLYSLFYFRKIKGILLPASIGLLCHFLILSIAYSSFVSYRNRSIYYSVHSLMKNDQTSYEQLVLVKIPFNAPIDQYMKETTNGITNSCPTCKVIKTETYQVLPAQFQGIFENQKINYTYVSITPNNKRAGEMRFMFPSFKPQLLCQALEAFTNQKKQMVGTNGTVTCIDTK